MASQIGAPVGGKEGYNYSDNVANYGGTWTYENLEIWLKKPSDLIKRSKMVLQTKKPQDRANIIAYMRSITENPPPLPVVEAPAVEEVPAEEAPAEEAPAEEAPAEGVEAPAEEAPAEEAPAAS